MIFAKKYNRVLQDYTEFEKINKTKQNKFQKPFIFKNVKLNHKNKFDETN